MCKISMWYQCDIGFKNDMIEFVYNNVLSHTNSCKYFWNSSYNLENESSSHSWRVLLTW